jgi:hypothetical protein
MIIKSHVRGGYRAAANYLKDVGANESTRLVEISDASASNLDEAFRNMWMVGRTTRAAKPLHHVSINPMKDERLTDAQVLLICARLEEKYGYRPGDHQRVIVEHIKDGRQHFHVMWNRISMRTGRPVWPGHHWNKSKQASREMEVELGLKRPTPRRLRRARPTRSNLKQRRSGHGRKQARADASSYLQVCKHPLRDLRLWLDEARQKHGRPRGLLHLVPSGSRPRVGADDVLRPLRIARAARGVEPEPRRPPQRHLSMPSGMSVEDLIAWAWKYRRADILAKFGIYVTFNL